MQEIINKAGPDVVIVAVGAPITYQAAINEVAFTGRVVYIGYANTGIAFDTKNFVQKELDIRGSRYTKVTFIPGRIPVIFYKIFWGHYV